MLVIIISPHEVDAAPVRHVCEGIKDALDTLHQALDGREVVYLDYDGESDSCPAWEYLMQMTGRDVGYPLQLLDAGGYLSLNLDGADLYITPRGRESNLMTGRSASWDPLNIARRVADGVPF